ncbi:hypothetical protein GCM10009678_86540 [Actinomadura kijaniata]|uniref:Uncharacterized membrane protein YhaH (DUF805 family) n=1 Tax=Actinomadura namibiensis TaxID=182080 RepID=A0A7W3M0R2_ACTNM|nr:DUF805 domain-containing protein [Actinomadura namibiensis]MBA8957729.1 uncharacterized membrane protein YhaH (DUF805 family) [Actinomadura namibiensis]
MTEEQQLQPGLGARAKAVARAYLDPRGRASRSEYIAFTLALFLAFGAATGADESNAPGLISWGIAYIALAMLPIWWIAVVRRLHDCGYSGLWSLFLPTPPGFLILLIVCAIAVGDPVPNRFGPPHNQR